MIVRYGSLTAVHPNAKAVASMAALRSQEDRHTQAGEPYRQPAGFSTRRVDAGYRAMALSGRTGRAVKLPPQFGQTPPSFWSTQVLQNVHSNVQIMASAESGGRSLSQHSQFGRISSTLRPG